MKKNKRKLIISSIAIVVIALMIKLYIVETTRISKMKVYENESLNVNPNNVSLNKVEETKRINPPSYKIIRQERIHNIKKSIDVRLSSKATKQQLRQIAQQLKDDLKESFDRIFIVYYLPEMQVGNGGWAITHFNTNLEVEILGLTIEEENQIIGNNLEETGNKNIGQWIDESPNAGCIMTLYPDGENIFLVRRYGDGSSTSKEMKAIELNGETRYVEVDGNDFGEYYLIDSRGNLGVFDNKGLIFTAIKKE